MKSLITMAIFLVAFSLTPVLASAGTDQSAAASPAISQPLVREGTLATRLVDVLKLGAAANEAEAESTLTGVGIAPKNGWIANYPVTPDIVGELQASIGDAATAGRLTMSKDAALQTFQDVLAGYNLAVTPGYAAGSTYDIASPAYDDPTVVNNYYYEEGPPVVTYYSPPPDYLYLYSWVPYPFWGWGFWFPGFFILADFDFDGHGHHGHDFDHDSHGGSHNGGHNGGHDGSVSNHFRDPGTGKMTTIDPANRVSGRTVAASGGSRWNSPSVQRNAQAIYTRSTSAVSRGNGTLAPSRNAGVTNPSSRSVWPSATSVSGRYSSKSGAGSSRIAAPSSDVGGSTAPVRNSGSRSSLSSGRTYTGNPVYQSGRTFSSQPTSRSPVYQGGRTFSSQQTYRSSSSYQGGGTFSQPAYRSPAVSSGRSFTAPSGGGGYIGRGSGGLSGGNWGGSGRGSFGGGRR